MGLSLITAMVCFYLVNQVCTLWVFIYLKYSTFLLSQDQLQRILYPNLSKHVILMMCNRLYYNYISVLC